MRKLTRSERARTPEVYNPAAAGSTTEIAPLQPAWKTKPKKETPARDKFPTRLALSPSEETMFLEIYSHLKTVLLVSASCIAIVAILYLLERQIDWVNFINTRIKEGLAGWNWKF